MGIVQTHNHFIQAGIDLGLSNFVIITRLGVLSSGCVFLSPGPVLEYFPTSTVR